MPSSPDSASQAELVGRRGGPVVVPARWGHDVARILWDHHVTQDKTTTRPQNARDACEERRLARAVEMVHGQGGDDEVEGSRRQRLAEVRHTKADAETGQAGPGRVEHGGLSSMPVPTAPG